MRCSIGWDWVAAVCADGSNGRVGGEAVAGGAVRGSGGGAWADAGFRVAGECESEDDPVAQAVVRASGGTAVAVPADVREMIALTRRAGLVIAGDTGPLHLAAALERPVVALFGPTDPARNGPYGTAGTIARVLRHAASREDHSRHRGTRGMDCWRLRWMRSCEQRWSCCGAESGKGRVG